MTSQIAVIPAQTRACLKALTESFATHQELKEHTDLIKKAAEVLCNQLVPEMVAFIATISHRSMGVGRFCLVHNHQLDDLILDSKWDQLVEHASRARELCVEIYDNDLLTDSEKQTIKEHLLSEYNAVLSAINNYKNNGPDKSIMPCMQSVELDYVDDKNGFMAFFSLTEQCHETICMASGKLATPMDTDRNKLVLDQGPADLTPILHCYDLLELLNDLLPEDPDKKIDRHSREAFDPLLSSELEARYSKELRMIKRYHQWLENNQV